MSLLFYLAFAALAALFLALELAAWRLGPGYTLSEWVWATQDRYGWLTRAPLLTLWLLLGAHLFLRHPH